jgi:hypothetical protein
MADWIRKLLAVRGLWFLVGLARCALDKSNETLLADVRVTGESAWIEAWIEVTTENIMNRVVLLFAVGTLAIVAGCSADGIIFNGEGQIEQFPIRSTPVVHYNLPSEVFDPGRNRMVLDINSFDGIAVGTFIERSPGYDLWPQFFTTFSCSDNPTCGTPAPVADFPFSMAVTIPGENGPIWPPSGDFPHPSITTSTTPASVFIAAWTLSLMNQWFLRDVNGSALQPPFPGAAPVTYESVRFGSMPISIHEAAAANVGYSSTFQDSPPRSLHQETGDPNTFGANGHRRVQTPLSNGITWAYEGGGAPPSIAGLGWREAPAQNTHIEVNTSTPGPGGNGMLMMANVPAPGGGSLNFGGGVYTIRYVILWAQITDGNSVIQTNDGMTFSYYLGAIGCQLMGYGLGLRAHSGFTAGAFDKQDDIMNQSIMQDMSFLLAPGHQLQFVVEDLLRMQDVSGGDWQSPGPNSTLPGSDRQAP